MGENNVRRSWRLHRRLILGILLIGCLGNLLHIYALGYRRFDDWVWWVSITVVTLMTVSPYSIVFVAATKLQLLGHRSSEMALLCGAILLPAMRAAAFVIVPDSSRNDSMASGFFECYLWGSQMIAALAVLLVAAFARLRRPV